MEEIWKTVQGYEDYQISNKGRLRSKIANRKMESDGFFYLKPIPNDGYIAYELYNPNLHKKKRFLAHRLVAIHFVPNPNGYPHVNHKDENRSNNCSDNLEWCTPHYNNSYGTAKLRMKQTISRPIEQYTPDGLFVAMYRNAEVASELLNISDSSIRDALNGKTKYGICKGYVWKYAQDKSKP